MVANFARAPKGGDTDQIKAVAAGECAAVISNSYYVARLMRSDKADDKKVVDKIGIVWPDQKGSGAHINVSGAGMLKHAPHKEAAVKFLEYLTSADAQRYFADGNNEWPAVPSVKVANPALEKLGPFKADASGRLARHVPRQGADDLRPRRLSLIIFAFRTAAGGHSRPLFYRFLSEICRDSAISGSRPTATIASEADASPSRSSDASV